MTKAIHASLAAIGRQLDAHYSPAVADPLPAELRYLVAQLVALEAGKRASTEQSVEIWQPAVARPGQQS